jgi:hypothetical protein
LLVGRRWFGIAVRHSSFFLVRHNGHEHSMSRWWQGSSVNRVLPDFVRLLATHVQDRHCNDSHVKQHAAKPDSTVTSHRLNAKKSES